jgi:hypothetical protein
VNIPRDTRKAIYLVVLALMPLLVIKGIVSQEEAPIYLGLAAAILAPALALNNLPPKK